MFRFLKITFYLINYHTVVFRGLTFFTEMVGACWGRGKHLLIYSSEEQVSSASCLVLSLCVGHQTAVVENSTEQVSHCCDTVYLTGWG